MARSLKYGCSSILLTWCGCQLLTRGLVTEWKQLGWVLREMMIYNGEFFHRMLISSAECMLDCKFLIATEQFHCRCISIAALLTDENFCQPSSASSGITFQFRLFFSGILQWLPELMHTNSHLIFLPLLFHLSSVSLPPSPDPAPPFDLNRELFSHFLHAVHSVSISLSTSLASTFLA